MNVGEQFSSLNDGKEKCSYNPLCQGISYEKCKGTVYELCYVGSETRERSDSCYYEKTGIFISI